MFRTNKKFEECFYTHIIYDLPDLNSSVHDPIINGFGRVITVDERGKIISIHNGKTIVPVLQQYRNMPPLKIGDPIHYLGNNSGVYVIGAFASDNLQTSIGFQPLDANTIQLSFGEVQFTLMSSGQIIIANHNAQIVIDNCGDIKLNSVQNITLQANERIELN